ncbi:MAG: hypothetical protein F6K34_03335 [Okeania sp. SIO4D6]|nr:hypothetical protein [Okeania sp. SIO4D6]
MLAPKHDFLFNAKKAAHHQHTHKEKRSLFYNHQNSTLATHFVIPRLPTLNPQLSLHEAPEKFRISHCTSEKMVIL